MPHSKRLIPALLMLITAFALFSAAGCSRKEEPKQAERITIAVAPWPASAPLYIAQEQGYFREEGLEATFLSYASGHLGLQAVLSGMADLAAATDTPIARSAVDGKPVAVIATICEIDEAILIIARKDRGISAPGDLKGKKIGVPAGSAAEYFLHIYLAASYISPRNVRIVSFPPDEIVDALLTGAVDAVSTWSPNTIILREKLAGKIIVLYDSSIYRMTWNIAAAQDYIGKNPERVEKFLRALLKAKAFIEKHPDESRAISSKYIGVTSPLYEKEWKNFHFTLMLDQTLILNLEDQARWMIRRSGGIVRKMPNFLDFIYTEALRSIQPRSVRMAVKQETI